MAGESLYFKSSPGDFNMQPRLSTTDLYYKETIKYEVTEFVKKTDNTIYHNINKIFTVTVLLYSYKLYTYSQQKLETA